jgi:hypothetical protein
MKGVRGQRRECGLKRERPVPGEGTGRVFPIKWGKGRQGCLLGVFDAAQIARFSGFENRSHVFIDHVGV